MTDRRSCWAAMALLLVSLGGSPPDKDRAMWSFRPVSRPQPPSAKSGVHPIDAFLAQRLSALKLSPAPPADKRTLIRRATFDLIGLPPTPEEVQAFEKDDRPDSLERLIDRLLASPQYGERWGRHWLDLVRYAETHGYERDDPKPNAWKYRDWVISALNRDLPYNRFLTEQLAGDELPDATDDSRIATGMYRLGPIDDEPADPVMDRFDQLDDMIKTIGTSMLGLTIHCARCHDHKFDPIKQSDYYRLVAFLTPSKKYVRGDETSISVFLASDSERERIATLDSGVSSQIAKLNARIASILSGHEKEVDGMPGDRAALILARLTPAEKSLKGDLEHRVKLLERYRPTGLPMSLGLTDAGAMAEPTHLMIRGDAHRPGKLVEPGFLLALGSKLPKIEPPRTIRSTGRRLALASWITSPENPLTARVMVNRIWMHHFGRGLVATPSDFGMMGEEPSNPELLDWLASEFVAREWSLKAMHRLMMTSQAYQRSGTWSDQAAELDSENATLWRFPPRRLEAEAIRDTVLFVSGTLNPQIGGPSVMPPIDSSVLAGQSRPGLGWKVSPPKATVRRSVYVLVKRTLGLPELDVLDAADNNEPCPRRFVTTTAPQALTLMNGSFFHEQAGAFAQRLMKDVGVDPRRQVGRAFWLGFGRQPTEDEMSESLDFLRSQEVLISKRSKSEADADPRTEALRAFCLVFMNTNEFVTAD